MITYNTIIQSKFCEDSKGSSKSFFKVGTIFCNSLEFRWGTKIEQQGVGAEIFGDIALFQGDGTIAEGGRCSS